MNLDEFIEYVLASVPPTVESVTFEVRVGGHSGRVGDGDNKLTFVVFPKEKNVQ